MQPTPNPDSEKLARVISVGELNRLAKELLEGNLPLMWVVGEISNFMRAASGHCYFSLKDAQAQVRCVMFRHKIQWQDWKPENGMQVEVRAYPSFYEARGEFQLNVEIMRRSGLGALFEAFEKLKAKLQAEGLFDPARKQPIPRFPRAIGIITSLKAAALRDVLTTLKRRMAAVPIIIYPAAVQGEDAPLRIAAALVAAQAHAECDVLIVCRGGGSIEDLWAFNVEAVARAIHACTLPVVSGVGHETDFTIADFVADARAPTPTAAAQMTSPNRDDLRQALGHFSQRLRRVTERALERRMQQLDVLARRLMHPGERIANQLNHLGHLATRLSSAWARDAESGTWQLREMYRQWLALRPDFDALVTEQQTLSQRLVHGVAPRIDAIRTGPKSLSGQLAPVNPHPVLEPGHSRVETDRGAMVRDSAQIRPEDEIKLTFARGWAKAKVRAKG